MIRGTLLVTFLISNFAFGSSLSFKEWKSRRVAEKSSVVAQLRKDKSLSAGAKKIKLSQAQFNLETERDLMPEDYFHLYIMEQFKKNPSLAANTLKKLSKEELADLAVNYIHATNQIRMLESNSTHLQTSR